MKIVIDGGHHYTTNGKRTPDGSMRESEFNFRVADLVKNELQYYENVEIKFTHDNDRDVPLSERCDIANTWEADVFVSIHANAYGLGGWNDVQGIESYVHTSKPEKAYILASKIQNQLLRNTQRPNRGVKLANFQVLRDTYMTAVLVECGFMTNKEEAELLKSEQYRLKCARAIIDGLVQHYNLKPTKKVSPKKVKIEGYIIEE